MKHQGPPLWIPATMFVLLFIAGLLPVTIAGGMPYFPGPDEPVAVMSEFFRTRSAGVFLCAFLQFGAAIPLGIFTATVVSRLRFLGVRAAGPDIAFFGGTATAVLMMISASVLSVMTYADIAGQPALLHALYRLSFAAGGPGFSVPFGLLAAGVSVPLLFGRYVPRWIGILGVLVGAAGALSWLQMVFPAALPLIPLTRFPGFVWVIAVALKLPNTRPA